MSVETPDNSLEHLYPAFADKVRATLAQVNRETAGKFAGVAGWRMFEGYRSQDRQNWLYAQGRTRPGAIVTHIKVSNHSSGMAADCYPYDSNGDPLWDAKAELWQALGHAARSNGLQWGGDYPKIFPGSTFVDQPHIEPPAALRLLWKFPALLFIRKLGI